MSALPPSPDSTIAPVPVQPRPSAFARTHTAGSAAMLLMVSAVASGLLGLLRTKIVNSRWGAGIEQDAYQAAFGLPDLISYFLIGGAASISPGHHDSEPLSRDGRHGVARTTPSR